MPYVEHTFRGWTIRGGMRVLVDAVSELLFTQLQYRSIAGPSALNGIIASTITSTISYNTLNSPINATSGKSYFYSLAFTGGRADRLIARGGRRARRG